MGKLSTVAVVTFVLGITDQAHAAGFAASRFGGELGHPTTASPTAIFYNPAGLALRTGTTIYAEGMAAWRSATYLRPPEAIDNLLAPGEVGAGTPADAATANSGEASLSHAIPSPFIGVVSDLGVPNLGVGAAFYVPYGGISIWDQNAAYADDLAYPGAVDGVQRWFSIEGTIRSMYFSAGGAYRFPELGLSLGLGLNLVYSEVDTLRARTLNATDDLVQDASGRPAEGRSWLVATGWDVALGAGVIYQPREDTWLGLSYQSQPGFGDMALEGTLTSRFAGAPEATIPIELEQGLPDVFRLGARFQPSPRLELRLFGDYTRWSAFDRQCVLDASDPNRSCALAADGSVDAAAGGSGVILNIPRDWENSFGVRAGLSYWLRPTVELQAGAGFDSNAIPDRTLDPALYDMPKLTFSLGARVAVTDSLAVLASYTQVVYFDRTVEPRTTAFSTPSRNPDGAGTYAQTLGALGVAVEYAF